MIDFDLYFMKKITSGVVCYQKAEILAYKVWSLLEGKN